MLQRTILLEFVYIMRYASHDKLNKNGLLKVYNTITPRSQEELESNQTLVFTFTRDFTMHLSTMWVQTL